MLGAGVGEKLGCLKKVGAAIFIFGFLVGSNTRRKTMQFGFYWCGSLRALREGVGWWWGEWGGVTRGGGGMRWWGGEHSNHGKIRLRSKSGGPCPAGFEDMGA